MHELLSKFRSKLLYTQSRVFRSAATAAAMTLLCAGHAEAKDLSLRICSGRVLNIRTT